MKEKILRKGNDFLNSIVTSDSIGAMSVNAGGHGHKAVLASTCSSKPHLPGWRLIFFSLYSTLGGLTPPLREHMTRPGQSEHKLPLATTTASGTGHMIPAQPMRSFPGIHAETTWERTPAPSETMVLQIICVWGGQSSSVLPNSRIVPRTEGWLQESKVKKWGDRP